MDRGDCDGSGDDADVDSDADGGAPTGVGDTCGTGLVYDCAMDCVDELTADLFTGDGFCDDGSFGYTLTCPEFDYDGGDCGGTGGGGTSESHARSHRYFLSSYLERSGWDIEWLRRACRLQSNLRGYGLRCLGEGDICNLGVFHGFDGRDREGEYCEVPAIFVGSIGSDGSTTDPVLYDMQAEEFDYVSATGTGVTVDEWQAWEGGLIMLWEYADARCDDSTVDLTVFDGMHLGLGLGPLSTYMTGTLPGTEGWDPLGCPLHYFTQSHRDESSR